MLLLEIKNIFIIMNFYKFFLFKKLKSTLGLIDKL
jgi:hypothetical protein